MDKLTWAEQYKHPNWQKKRLEVMQAAGFTCETCGGKDTTLNVHHKRYVKGRKVWDYSRDELQCLCEPCHSEEHSNRELLNRLLNVGTSSLIPAIGLLAGYLVGEMDIDIEEADYQAAMEVAEPWVEAGILASLVSHRRPEVFARAVQASGLPRNAAHESALDRWQEAATWNFQQRPEAREHIFQGEGHDHLQHLAWLVGGNGPICRDSVASLVAGFCGYDMSSPYVGDPEAYLAGEIASLLDPVNIDSALSLIKVLKARDRSTIQAALRTLVEDLQTRPDVAPAIEPRAL